MKTQAIIQIQMIMVQLPVDEGAQEIPLAKLDHAVRILGPREGITIQALHLVVVLMGLCPCGGYG